MQSIRTLFFDYDGCLHNSIKIYAPAFRKAYQFLQNERLAIPRGWADEEIAGFIGQSSVDMWQAFMPQLDDEKRLECANIIGEEMRTLTENGLAKLYEGAPEVLTYLREKRYTLVMLSNCRLYYKDCHIKAFGLDAYFDAIVCSEEYGFMSKVGILQHLLGQYPPEYVMIGDRFLDVEAGKKNEIFTIGCRYGFAKEGELSEADLCIEDIRDLMALF